MNRTVTPSTHRRVRESGRSRRLRRLQARRRLWLKVHLWLGLGLGLFLAVIGVTGSVLVFWHEIDESLNPDLYRASIPPGPERKPLDEILAAAERAAAPGWESGWLDAPAGTGMNYVFSFYYPEQTPTPPPEEAVALNIAVNPYTAEAVGRRVFYHARNPLRHCLIGFVFKLHYALLLKDFGVILVGAMAVLFLISVLTGLILWWPLDSKWRRVLTIKRRASAVRVNHDLHQTSGFYTLIVLLALLISGFYFNLPEQFRWLVERFSPLTPEPTASGNPGTNMPSINLEAALARSEYPGGVPQFYSFSPSDEGLFTACYRDIPELRPHVLDSRCLVLDRRSGELLQVRDPAHGSGGDVFVQWQWPLHSGKVFGLPGRILVFLSGLACPVLYVTGIIRWLQKRRARQFKKPAQNRGFG
ncbi:PepSY-associated TM helix domain-containing protein [Methylocaldum sp.]|uniref:PepSY-associated TM helix domain-containing protein n=1 Tax=Methylocaldum sp. TaxID=1969727 RepID=UPI00321F7E56